MDNPLIPVVEHHVRRVFVSDAYRKAFVRILWKAQRRQERYRRWLLSMGIEQQDLPFSTATFIRQSFFGPHPGPEQPQNTTMNETTPKGPTAPFNDRANAIRNALRSAGTAILDLRRDIAGPSPAVPLQIISDHGEVTANLMLAYRHVEDAAMRLGKAIQAWDGGISCYDRNVTPPPVEELARLLYTAYCEAVGGKAFNGDPLPAWPDFAADPDKQKQADAWRATARIRIGSSNLQPNPTHSTCECRQTTPTTLPDTAQPDWQKRVIAEKVELDARLQSLRTFLGSKPFSELPFRTREMLTYQETTMQHYSEILGCRIAAFSTPEPLTAPLPAPPAPFHPLGQTRIMTGPANLTGQPHPTQEPPKDPPAGQA